MSTAIWKDLAKQLSSFKSVQLKNLNANIGASVSGTKPTLITNAVTSLQQKSPLSASKPLNGESFVVLAIDVGIKNFSFCRIQLDKNLPFNKPPTVTEWKKLDLTKLYELELTKFDPFPYSQLCQKIIQNVLYNPKMGRPDVVLIERQRARSNSSKDVKEWILKVNMFESMLFGMVYSKILQDTPDLLANLISVSPQRMGGYYKIESEQSTAKPTNKQRENSKAGRIEIVEKWLRHTISPEDHFREPKFHLDRHQFPFTNTSRLSKINSKSKWVNELIVGPDSKRRTSANKGDDLVDSLLHALSWVEWERNKMILKMELLTDAKEGMNVSDGFLKAHYEQLK